MMQTLHVIMAANFFATANGKFLKGANIVDKKIHQSKLVAKAHQNEVAGWMKGDAVSFLSEFLVQIQVA